jgi:hypothetical protein
MLIKTLSFNKLQKTKDSIEQQLNDFLATATLKFATQNESVAKGKFIISLFYEPKKGNIRAKIFKSQIIADVDREINAFLEEHDMKLVTQTFVGSNVYTIVFYADKKASDKTEE